MLSKLQERNYFNKTAHLCLTELLMVHVLHFLLFAFILHKIKILLGVFLVSYKNMISCTSVVYELQRLKAVISAGLFQDYTSSITFVLKLL